MRRKVLAILLTLTIHLNTSAQIGKVFNTDNQLSSNLVLNVYQDRDGFIWIATRNGINRYDGYQVRIFKKGDLGLGSDYVNCIAQNKKGIIFIGCNNTIQAYDGAAFTTFDIKGDDGHSVRTYINYIAENRAGDMLACTSGFGVIKLDEENHTGTRLTELSGEASFVRFLLEDQQGRYWIITENDGLTLVEGKKRTHFFTDEENKSLLQDIRQDRNGVIYLSVNGKGIYRYDNRQRQFVFIEKTAGLPVLTMHINSSNQLLIGCDGQGIMLYNPQKDVLVRNPYYSRDTDLTKSKVFSLLEDRNGNLWAGLLYKGVFMQPRQRIAFGYMGDRIGSRNLIGSNCVTSTYIDKKQRIWIGTDKDGVYVMDQNGANLHHYTDCPSTVLSMAEDINGHVWLGSYAEGAGWIDPQNGAWHPAELGIGKRFSVFGLAAGSNGDMWFGTMGNGLLRMNLNTGKVTAFTMKAGADNNRSVNSIPNNYLSKLYLSPDGKRLYVASSVGLSCYDISHNSWTNVLKGNCPNYGTFSRAVYADQKGRVWMGSNDGLYCYDLRQHKDRYYTTSEGLPSNGIASIVPDKDGNLWLGTDHGLCCFNPEKETTKNYYVDNGLQGSEFSDGAASVNEHGMLLFGGTGGISWFRPESIQPMKWNAKVHITSLFIGNTEVTTGAKSGVYTVTKGDIMNSDRFDLCYADNSFTILFSTFTYVDPEHITYMYSINGEEWKKLQTGTNDITFSHLQEGTYHFRVKAMNDQQETDIREFVVKIHAPWYASGWATLLYLLLAIAGIVALIRFRKRKVQDQLRLQSHIHAEQMADAKLRFFMNISHEIRTPMTLIVTPLQTLIKQDNDPHRRSIYETIQRNAERILSLINQMMDLRKIDKGQMQMHMCETDLIEFVGDIHSLFVQQAKTKNVQFNYEHEQETLPVWIDRRNFDKVVVNILSNAFKFTPAGGTISIRIAQQDGNAVISVRDNGEGIPEDKLQRIFERFYQLPTSSNLNRSGTGIGLDLTRSLVELHHGTIEARNNADGKGCEFVVTIPLGNRHLQPEEMEIKEEEVKEEIMPDSIEEESPVMPEEEQPKTMPRMSKSQHIVVVEDDNEIRQFLTTELSQEYKVTACENGLEGMKEVLRTVPHLVISDVMMPEMDGNTLCSKIKSNPATNHIPVILLTAKNRDEDQLEGLATGADAYLIKPFNMDILRRTIVNLIQKNYLLSFKYGRNDQLEEHIEDIKMKSPDDKLLERVMAVINKNISNSDLSVDRIADEVGISRVHLHRKMKELTGQTPHDFIRNIRLKQAAHLLTKQSMNITEVMYACGFNNSASFSTIFKKFYGLSPRDYMKEHEKEE